MRENRANRHSEAARQGNESTSDSHGGMTLRPRARVAPERSPAPRSLTPFSVGRFFGAVILQRSREVSRRLSATSPGGPVDSYINLCDWLRSGPQIGTERFAYVAQMAFMHELSNLEETLDFLQLLRERFSGTYEILRAFDVDESDRFPGKVDLQTFHEVLSLRMGIASVKAKLEWCDASIKLVTARMRKGEPNA